MPVAYSWLPKKVSSLTTLIVDASNGVKVAVLGMSYSAISSGCISTESFLRMDGTAVKMR